MRLFAKHGYDGVGVAELSEALGVNPPSLYAAFGSKRGLFERAVQLYRERFETCLPEALDSEPRLERAIARLFEAAVDGYTRDPEAPGCMIIEGGRSAHDAGACALLSDAHQATRAVILERLRRDDAPEPEVLTDYILAILSGLSASARRGLPKERMLAVASIAAEGFAARLSSLTVAADPASPAQ
jgi:TetR/AcrR family transcriptional repressor for divergent bdcA